MRRQESPTVKFTATNYKDLIDWSYTEVSDLPLLESLTIEELRLLPDAKEGDALFNFPVHSQAVERVEVDVTEASKHGCEATAYSACIFRMAYSARVRNGGPVACGASRDVLLRLHEIIRLRAIPKKGRIVNIKLCFNFRWTLRKRRGHLVLIFTRMLSSICLLEKTSALDVRV